MSVSSTATLSGWRWRQHGNADEPWKQCTHQKPTTEIFTDLMDAKIIPDPFIDENERLVQWVGEADWEYACDFHYEPNANHTRQDLTFASLDTVATVYLNGEDTILESTNMFHRHRVDVTGKLLRGLNTVRILFRSALHYGRELEKKHGSYRAFSGENSRAHVRKAQYHYGWDWGPLLMTCGPCGEIRLETYSSMLNDIFVDTQVSDDLESASMEISFDAILDRHVSVNVTVTAPNGHIFTSSVALGKKEIHGSCALDIPHPELWYPIGHGPQVFYIVEMVVMTQGQVPLQYIKKTVGVRRVRLVQEPLLDEPGTSFYFDINNNPVYSSGSNWIPGHSFLTAMTPNDYASAVDLCVKGNQNMLRIWGGGIYEHDALYEECDRRGILVWQDFAFACAQYPCYPEFAATVQREAVDQVKRLRQYCSIVLYAGNNEDYQIAEMLNLTWDPKDTSGDWTNTNFPARTLYETYLPAVVAKYSPGVPYHPSSPWGGNGTTDGTVGDIHQWNVWHGSQEKYQLWDKLTGRFVSEFGMLGFPAAKSIRRFVTDPTQRYPQSRVLDLHNKADGAERRLALYVLENIRVDSLDLDSWIYATQLIQSECLAFAVRSCRRRWKGPGREYCAGQLIWQINDCWPVSSWALVDFYGEKKLAYFATMRDSALLSLGISRSTPELKKFKSPPPQVLAPPHDLAPKHYVFDVWAMNGTLEDVHVQIEVRMYDIESGVLREERLMGTQILSPNRSIELLEDLSIDGKTSVQAIMRDPQNGRVIARASDWPQPLKYVTLSGSPDVSVSVLDGKLEVRSRVPVKGLVVSVPDDRDVGFEDNGVDVFPDDVYTIYASGLIKGEKIGVRYYGSDFST